MKISLNWINELVDIGDFLTKPRELADVLVSAGLEVEQIENSRLAMEIRSILLKITQIPFRLFSIWKFN